MTNRKKKVVYVEKDGIRAEATKETFKGLVSRGWTVVDDGTKEEKKAAEEEAKAVKQLEEQELKLFGIREEN